MYLVHGQPGTGKTLLGMHFLEEGLNDDETVLFIHGEESKEEIVANGEAVGIDVTDAEFLDLGPDPDFFTEDYSYDLVDPNGIEYSGEERPEITITAQRTDTEWQISVHDDGIGIAVDDQERIFEVFQRLHSHEERSGTGIGLALCKRIVKRHDGRLWVESALNEGATFSFTLPVASTSEREEREQAV